MNTDQPTLMVTIPGDDRSFASYVRAAYAAIGGTPGTGATRTSGSTSPEGVVRPSPGRLEAAIRVRYPAAVVRSRNLSGEPFMVWYVYRDGGWRPADAPADVRGGGR